MDYKLYDICLILYEFYKMLVTIKRKINEKDYPKISIALGLMKIITKSNKTIGSVCKEHMTENIEMQRHLNRYEFMNISEYFLYPF